MQLVSKKTLEKLSANGHNLRELLKGSQIAFKRPLKREETGDAVGEDACGADRV